MRVMIDTNVLVSALLFPNSLPSKVVEKVLLDHDLILCSQIVQELQTVFERKFKEQTKHLENALRDLHFELVHTPESFNQSCYPDLKDKKDLPILVSAIMNKVDILITGDKDFFEVISEKPKIISPRSFINSY